MKVKPKKILVNLPIVLLFRDYHEIPAFSSNLNTIINGKIKIKYEELGVLGGQYVAIFYLDRYSEFQQLRSEFKTAIEQEEINHYNDNNKNV